MRLFVAVRPPSHAIQHLEDFLDVRRAAAPYRWTSPEHFHLTLAFAGHVPDRTVDDVETRLDRAAGKRHAIPVRIAGGGAFPHPDRARVLYAALDLVESDRSELDRLAAGARTAMATSGARVDGQRFRPHLTLARLGRPDNVSSWVRLLDGYAGPEWLLDEVSLYASHLGEGPRRSPRHEVLSTHRLA